MLPAVSTYGAWLAIVRIITGIIWFIHGIGKVLNPQWAVPGGTCAQLLQQMTAHTTGAYHDFIINTVLPNISIFAHLVAFGETLTGVSLILGLLSRFGGFVGVFLALNYWAAKGSFAHLDGYSGLDMTTAALSFVHWVLPTGRVAGFDALFGRTRRTRASVINR